MTNYYESATVPGIFFAGTIGQGVAGLKKYGIPANSGAVHGARYNARLMVQHVAETRFGVERARGRRSTRATPSTTCSRRPPRRPSCGTRSRTSRARCRSTPAERIRDEGIVSAGATSSTRRARTRVAITVETDDTGDIHPAVYVREQGKPAVETLLSSHPLHDFRHVGEPRRSCRSVLEASHGAVRRLSADCSSLERDQRRDRLLRALSASRVVARRDGTPSTRSFRGPDVLGPADCPVSAIRSAAAARRPGAGGPWRRTAPAAYSPAIVRATSCSPGCTARFGQPAGFDVGRAMDSC